MVRRTAVSEVLRPVIRALLGTSDPSITIRFWDGSKLGCPTSKATVTVGSPMALRRLLWSPDELGLGRAYVAGDIDIEGDIYEALDVRKLLAAKDEGTKLSLGVRGWLDTVQAGRRLGVLGPPPPAPAEEARLRGRLHTRRRDSAAISHHYDVSNDFYRLVLGPTMTYSCAYFERDDSSLDEAQEAKYEHICRKLGLRPGMRLLDVGCGWGGMALHAARHHDVEVVGVTLSKQQHDRARQRVGEAGLDDRVDIRVQDYRDVHDGPFDAISSIGMFEHVGLERLGDYFANLHELLVPQGRLLNHAIARTWVEGGRAKADRRSFIERYVFPDGELLEVGQVVSAMAKHGFEVRDLESLREHYARTLRSWVANLERNWDEAVAQVGLARARIWRLYMAGSAVNFEAGRTFIYQVLGVKTDARGVSGMPPTREAWYEQPAYS